MKASVGGSAGRKRLAIPKSDPAAAIGKIAKKAAVKRAGAEGPKKSVKGPVRGGPATGKGKPANKRGR